MQLLADEVAISLAAHIPRGPGIFSFDPRSRTNALISPSTSASRCRYGTPAALSPCGSRQHRVPHLDRFNLRSSSAEDPNWCFGVQPSITTQQSRQLESAEK